MMTPVIRGSAFIARNAATISARLAARWLVTSELTLTLYFSPPAKADLGVGGLSDRPHDDAGREAAAVGDDEIAFAHGLRSSEHLKAERSIAPAGYHACLVRGLDSHANGHDGVRDEPDAGIVGRHKVDSAD